MIVHPLLRLVACAALLPGLHYRSAAADATASSPLSFHRDIRPILQEFCYDCHADGANKGGIALDEAESAALQKSGKGSAPDSTENSEVWWKVLKNVRAGLMPPQKKPQPTQAQKELLAQWIKRAAFGIDPQNPDPGRVTARRLNRVEYRNTIRDLMGIDFNSEVEFPPDDTGYGFDDIGDVLTVSPLLLEKYMVAAKTIVSEAVPTVEKIVPERSIPGSRFHDISSGNENPQKSHKDSYLSFSYYEPAAASNRFHLDDAGAYHLTLELAVKGEFDFDPGKCRVVFKVDDAERLRKEFGWYDHKTFRFEFDEKWQPGDHRMLLNLEPLTPTEKKINSLYLHVVSATIRGPMEEKHWTRPKNYDRFFTRDAPKSPVERGQYATEVLRKFVTKAYRRPVDEETVQRLVALAEKVYTQPDKSFEAGIAHAMVAVLSSPRFLFRLEDPQSITPAKTASAESSNPDESPASKVVKKVSLASLETGGLRAKEPGKSQDVAPIDEYSLASRLSYFLWSTMPDEELFRLASSGELRKNLSSQIKRMLADSRSEALVQNFVGQWLQTRDMDRVDINSRAVLARDAGEQRDFSRRRERFRELTAIPEEKRTPEQKAELQQMFERRRRFQNQQQIELDHDLRRAMREETEKCFDYILRQDRSVLELIDADYTFLNEKLAHHYGLTNLNLSGSEMRRVTLPASSARGGVLTDGSVLVVTSNPDRTSPVKRGLFILDNVLGTPTPPPPANVPALEVAEKDFKDHEPTLREALGLHREKPLCASCHNRMDPIGLAFENFNALGMWRENERKQPIESAGKLITGETFDSVRDLKHILITTHRMDFYRCLTEKFLTYAIGRGVEYYDIETMDKIVQRLDNENGRFSALLTGVIESAPFQKMRTRATETASGPGGTDHTEAATSTASLNHSEPNKP
jgi:hypothetical protein